MNTEKPPKGWTKRQWALAQNAVELAVSVERERCAREAEQRCCMEMPARVRIPCKHIACAEVRFVADRIREGPNPPWKRS